MSDLFIADATERDQRRNELIDIIRNAEQLEKQQFDRIKQILEGSPSDWKIANTKKKDGTSILMMAARQGFSKLVQYLLEQGSHVTSVNRDHSDALMFACVSGKKDIIEPILLAKADVNFKNKIGCTALMAAAERGHDKIVQMLVTEYKADIHQQMKNGANALIYAIVGKSRESVDCLIQARANLNHTLKDGSTPLTIAAERNVVDIVSLLIRQGANVNHQRSKTGDTALHMACNAQSRPVAAALINGKADVHACDKNGRTPLMYAVTSPDLVQDLLKAGADINFPDDGGNTALMYACAQSSSPVVLMSLVSAKADVEFKNERNETALTIAQQLNKHDVVNLLNYKIKGTRRR